MKKVFLAVCLTLVVSGVAFAGDCVKCKPVQATVTQTVEVTKTVVTAPVRVVGGLRARVAARRATRLAVRQAAACAACTSCSPAPAVPAAAE